MTAVCAFRKGGDLQQEPLAGGWRGRRTRGAGAAQSAKAAWRALRGTLRCGKRAPRLFVFLFCADFHRRFVPSLSWQYTSFLFACETPKRETVCLMVCRERPRCDFFLGARHESFPRPSLGTRPGTIRKPHNGLPFSCALFTFFGQRSFTKTGS